MPNNQDNLLKSLKVSFLTHIIVSIIFVFGLALLRIFFAIIYRNEVHGPTPLLHCPELGNTFAECSGWFDFTLTTFRNALIGLAHYKFHMYFIIPFAILLIIIFLFKKYPPKTKKTFIKKKIYLLSIPLYITLSILILWKFKFFIT